MKLYEQDNILVAIQKLDDYCKENFEGDTYEIISIEATYYPVEDMMAKAIIAKVSRFYWDEFENDFSSDTGLTMLCYTPSIEIEEFIWKEVNK